MLHSRLDVRGGAENSLCSLACGLRERQHEVAVAAQGFDPSFWPDGEWDGIAVHKLTGGAFGLLARQRQLAQQTITVSALSQSVDLVVAHNFPACVWATKSRGQSKCPRVVWYCHEPLARLHCATTQPTLMSVAKDPDRRPWMRPDALAFQEKLERRPRQRAIDRQLDQEAVAKVDSIIANSAFTAQMVSQVYGRDASICRPGVPKPTQQWAPALEPFVAWITSNQHHKNARGFLEAVRIAVHELGARDLAVRAVGIRTPEFQQMLDAANLAGSVVLEPRLSTLEFEELLATARLVAYPSLDEPFGMVSIEAMANARPVLAPSVGGPPEVVEPGVTGRLVDPLDPTAMARALLELWQDPVRADELGAQGRLRYEKEFSVERFLDRFEAQAIEC